MRSGLGLPCRDGLKDWVGLRLCRALGRRMTAGFAPGFLYDDGCAFCIRRIGNLKTQPSLVSSPIKHPTSNTQTLNYSVCTGLV